MGNTPSDLPPFPPDPSAPSPPQNTVVADPPSRVIHMEAFWKGAERWWNQNRVLAWALVLIGFVLALWVSIYPQSPGVSIGLLAGVAGIMSVRPKMHPAEKFAWVTVLVAFTILEVRAIHVSDQKNQAALQGQNAVFQRIADGLNGSIQASKDQYSSTIDHVDGVLKTTQGVALLAQKNLENVTGGDAFAYVFPSEISDGEQLVTLNVHNDGAQVLSAVVVTIRRVLRGSLDLDYGGEVDLDIRPPIPIGPLAPHEGRSVPGATFVPQIGPSGIASYQVWINAQNPGVNEHLFFRRSKSGTGWAYKLEASREIRGKRKKGDVFVKRYNTWIRYLKVIDWTEPAKRQ